MGKVYHKSLFGIGQRVFGTKLLNVGGRRVHIQYMHIQIFLLSCRYEQYAIMMLRNLFKTKELKIWLSCNYNVDSPISILWIHTSLISVWTVSLVLKNVLFLVYKEKIQESGLSTAYELSASLFPKTLAYQYQQTKKFATFTTVKNISECCEKIKKEKIEVFLQEKYIHNGVGLLSCLQYRPDDYWSIYKWNVFERLRNWFVNQRKFILHKK